MPTPEAKGTCAAADRLRRLYRLSPAEAEVAVAVGGGDRLAELAVTRGVSYETVRNQLKAVFAKAGLHTQADLARLLARIETGDGRHT